MHICHEPGVFLYSVICANSGENKKKEENILCRGTKILYGVTEKVFDYAKKHVKTLLNVKNMTNFKKNIAQSFIT